jgi:hypothetical protein
MPDEFVFPGAPVLLEVPDAPEVPVPPSDPEVPIPELVPPEELDEPELEPEDPEEPVAVQPRVTKANGKTAASVNILRIFIKTSLINDDAPSFLTRSEPRRLQLGCFNSDVENIRHSPYKHGVCLSFIVD